MEELTDDRGDEDAERNCGEDIAGELQRIKRGEIGLDEADVIEQAIFQREGGRDDRDLRNNDQPLQPRITYVGARADGKVDAEQDEGDEHPLEGEDPPEDSEGREEAGKVSGLTDKGRNHIHDAEKKPGIPLERLGQYHPISQQEAECGEEQNEHDVDQPAGERGRAPSPRHQPHLRRTDFPCHIAINDGSDLPRMSMKGLANEPGHSGEWQSVHGEDLVLRLHAGASGLGQRMHQKTGAVGVIERRPGTVGIEETVKVRSGAGGIKERRTNSQDGQQQVRKFGGVGLHLAYKAFLLLL